MTENITELLTFFKALADSNRLRIVGLLSKESYTVEQLAAMLGLGESTVSHHLSKLSEAGLVTATAQSYYNYYRLEKGQLEKMAQRLLSDDALPAAAEGVDTSGYERKILNDFLMPDGSLKTIPAQRKKLQIIMRRIVQDFQPGARYTEKEVNNILKRYHEDTASLRRELISMKLMARESAGEAYWRLDEAKETGSAE